MPACYCSTVSAISFFLAHSGQMMSSPSVMKPLPTMLLLQLEQMKQSLCQWRPSNEMNLVPPIPDSHTHEGNEGWSRERQSMMWSLHKQAEEAGPFEVIHEKWMKINYDDILMRICSYHATIDVCEVEPIIIFLVDSWPVIGLAQDVHLLLNSSPKQSAQ